jgi:hypothetical protein
MSTKIYNGYMINRILTFQQAKDMIRPFQEKVRGICRRKVATQAAGIASAIIDRRCLSLPTEADKPPAAGAGFYAFNAILQGYGKSRQEHARSEYDYECEVTFLPCRRRTLLLLFSEQEEYDEEFARIGKVREYAYYNNTDPPEGFRKGEGYRRWQERGKDWDEALGSDPPIVRGFNIQCLGELGLPIPMYKDMLAYMPTFRDRVRSQALGACLTEKAKELEYEEGEPLPPNWGGTWAEVTKWIRTSEGKEEMRRQEEAIRTKLKPEITSEDLSAVPGPTGSSRAG